MAIASILQPLPIRQHELLQAARPRRAQIFDGVVPVDVLHARGHASLHTGNVVRESLRTVERMSLEVFADPADGSLMQKQIWTICGLPSGGRSSERPEAGVAQGGCVRWDDLPVPQPRQVKAWAAVGDDDSWQSSRWAEHAPQNRGQPCDELRHARAGLLPRIPHELDFHTAAGNDHEPPQARVACTDLLACER